MSKKSKLKARLGLGPNDVIEDATRPAALTAAPRRIRSSETT
jgi:hypothetical protein